MDDHSIQKIALETARNLLAAEHSQPFGFGIDVYKGSDKIFMMTMTYQNEKIITIKCSPQDSEMLRDIYLSIRLGYHMADSSGKCNSIKSTGLRFIQAKKSPWNW